MQRVGAGRTIPIENPLDSVKHLVSQLDLLGCSEAKKKVLRPSMH